MMYLDELFVTLEGETEDTGLPTIFIRLWGCPVGCSYCDTPQRKENRKRISIGNLVDEVNRNYRWCNRVCLTGGEPLIYEDAIPLVYELQQKGYKVSIETSGCVPIEKTPYKRSFKYVMDIKSPSSGVMRKNIYENLLALQSHDEVKFVVKDRKDYDFMRDVLRKYPTSAKILVSPMFDKDKNPMIGKELVEWILQDHLNDVRLSCQVHKFIGFA